MKSNSYLLADSKEQALQGSQSCLKVAVKKIGIIIQSSANNGPLHQKEKGEQPYGPHTQDSKNQKQHGLSKGLSNL